MLGRYCALREMQRPYPCCTDDLCPRNIPGLASRGINRNAAQLSAFDRSDAGNPYQFGVMFHPLCAGNQKRYQESCNACAADPLECPECKGPIRIIALVEGPQLIGAYWSI